MAQGIFTLAYMSHDHLHGSHAGLPMVERVNEFLKMFGDIISSKIVRLAFWHWTLELGFTRLNAQWPSLRHFQRFDSPFIVYYYISFDLWNQVFLELWIFKNFCCNLFRILGDFLRNFSEFFSLPKFSETSKFYSGTLVPA